MRRSLKTIEITIPERLTKGFPVLKVVLMSFLMRQCIAKKVSISEFISFVRLESGSDPPPHSFNDALTVTWNRHIYYTPLRKITGGRNN